ncbi:hypothetical protein U1Q18_051879, partial [Sarracenia purpurea var. burkii]
TSSKVDVFDWMKMDAQVADLKAAHDKKNGFAETKTGQSSCSFGKELLKEVNDRGGRPTIVKDRFDFQAKYQISIMSTIHFEI